MRQFVLIGAGHASASAARTLRREGFDGAIVIVGEEVHPPYQRPPLSKEHLAGEPDLDDVWSASAEWCAGNGVELRLGVRAERITLAPLGVVLADGETLPAEAVLIATGVRPRTLPGVTSSRVHYLKTLEDAAGLRAALERARHVVVVGGGFIGLEVAAAARGRGAEVTLFEAAATPLGPILGDEIGAAVTALHRAQGVAIHAGATVQAIEDGAGGAIVRASDDTVVTADLVVVGIGTIPNDEIARASEITVGNGIRVDQYGRTSALGVYAAGDVANHYHTGLDARVRVEHFDNAARQGAVVARNMIGQRADYDDVHWFWSDQYDHNLQFAGHTASHDRIVIRGSLEGADFVAFYMKGDRIVAVFAIDRGGDVMAAKTLIAERRAIADDMLRDENMDLAEIAFALPKDAAEIVETAQQSDPEALAAAGYQKVARSGQISESMVRRFVASGVELAIARSAGAVYALHNVCTHLACKLAAGKIEGAGLTCLCHGSVFELATGIPINPPATKPVRTFPVVEADGQIFVKID